MNGLKRFAVVIAAIATFAGHGGHSRGVHGRGRVVSSSGDQSAPTLSATSPLSGATNVATDTSIAFSIVDTETQINLASVQVTVDGVDAVINGVIQAAFNGSGASIAQAGNNVNVTLKPTTDFQYRNVTDVAVQATSPGGSLNTSYSFTIRDYSLLSTSFDGLNQYVATAVNASEFNGASNITWSFWAKSDAWYQGGLISRYTSSGNNRNFFVEVQTSKNLKVLLSSAGTVSNTHWTSAADVLTPGAWQHVVVAYDGAQATNATKLRVWLNGVEITGGGTFVGTIPASIGTVTQPLLLGAYQNVLHFGLLDEVGIWVGATASPTQAVALYNSGVTFDLATSALGTPTHFYKMGDSDSVTIINRGSTASRDLTLTNMYSTSAYTSDVPGGTAVGRVRLTAMGDSLTAGTGSTDSHGWRSIVRASVSATPLVGGKILEFVGPVQTAAVEADHFAQANRLIGYYVTGSNLTSVIGPGTAKAHPEIVTLLIGTNNCIENGTTYDGTTTPDLWESVLVSLYAQQPTAKVIALTVPNLQPTSVYYVDKQPNIVDFNAKLPAKVTARQLAGQTITLIDTMSAAGLTADDYDADGIHFNDAGYAKLAAAIEAQIRAYAL